jgi:putative endopeptidase
MRHIRLVKVLFSAAVLALVAAFAQQATAPETHGIVLANIDRSVKPGDDFYRFANGDWIKRTEIPPDRAVVDVFTKLADLSNKRTNDLIEEIAKSNAPAGSGERKVRPLQLVHE